MPEQDQPVQNPQPQTEAPAPAEKPTEEQSTATAPTETAIEVLNPWPSESVKNLPALSIRGYLGMARPLAKNLQSRTGLYYLVPLVQSVHESRYGNSLLAKECCNIFGVIATPNWLKNGRPHKFYKTREFIAGAWVIVDRPFRVYGSWLESFDDWSEFICRMGEYTEAVKFMRQGQDFGVNAIREIAKHYATDPQYAESMERLYLSIKQEEPNQ